jgi:hypothetical protein
MTTEATDIRFAVDTEEMPLSYPEWRGQAAQRLVVEVPGRHLLVSFVLPTETAREWAGELFAGVASAYREATGDPHAMSAEEVAGFTRAGYDPPAGIHVSGEECSPARVRFEVAFDVLGLSLSIGNLRAAIVAALQENFQTDHICVSDGQPITGTVTR